MSTFAGIFYWDSRPIEDSALATLAAHCRGGGPDGGGTIQPQSGLALQAFSLHFDALSERERQPHIFGRGAVLTWDGRLDNRDDLLLALHHDLTEDLTDAALVATAYQRWGVDCLPRLIGDWSLAVWDPTQQRIVLACDYMSARPLYYRELPEGGLAWASDLEALVESFDLYSQPNEDYVAGRLFGWTSASQTPFSSIFQLRAGHVLTASRESAVVVRRYWKYQPSTIRYRDPRDYSEHLRVLLTEGVRVRLRAAGTVWSHLSGGWDSSSMFCLGHRLVSRRLVEATRLKAVSLIFSGNWADCNEGEYIEAVERWTGCSTTSINNPPFPSVAYMRNVRIPVGAADFVLGSLDGPALAAGARVNLSGSGGDQVMMRSVEARAGLFEPLADWEPLRFVRLCAARARAMRSPFLDTLSGLLREVYVDDIRHRFASHVRIPQRRLEGLTPRLIQRAARYVVDPVPDVREFPRAKRRLVETMYTLGEQQNYAACAPLYRTYPYRHRPLVDFALGVPILALWEPGGPPRAGMRRALSDILPPEILTRESKMMAGSSVARSKREQVDGIEELGPPERWLLVQRGYLDPAAVIQRLTRYRKQGAMQEMFPTRWLHVEAWLQALQTPLSRRLAQPSPTDLIRSYTLHQASTSSAST